LTGVSPLRGGGLSRLRVEPLSKAQRLAPDGQPSLTQIEMAGSAGRDHEGGPSRGRGSRALMSVAGTRPTVPLDELARCSRAARHFAALRSAAHAALVPDRHPGHPPRPEPGRLNTRTHELARSGSTAAPVAHLRLTWCHVGRRAAGPRCRGRAPRAADAPGVPVTPAAVARPLFGAPGRFPEAGSAHRDPPTAPPSRDEGDLWGDLQCGGPGNRFTVRRVRARVEQPPPPPARPQGRERGEPSRRISFQQPKTGSGWSFR
jgi:hypothetical protein